MDIFDYVIMGVGSLLIVIGLVLFISGKRESANHSQVEGFGIKVNVTNPSIILIVFGIGLLLVPKLLPTPPDIEPTSTANLRTAPDRIEADTQVKTEPADQPSNQPVPTAPQQKPSTAVWFPSGTWQLTAYELNGMDQSEFVEAEIHFVNQSASNTVWNSQFVITDGWGNFATYYYQGDILHSGNGYAIRVTQSNDPNFVTKGAVPLELKMDNNTQLHMAYFYAGSNLLLHWSQ